jgi:hypothetical protein
MPKESKKDTKVSKRADDGKKRRAKKDPNAPKRGLSAYMFFSQAHRKVVQEENPEAGFGKRLPAVTRFLNYRILTVFTAFLQVKLARSWVTSGRP